MQPGKASPNPSLVQAGTPGRKHGVMSHGKEFGLPPIPGKITQPPKQGVKNVLPGAKPVDFTSGKQKGSMQATGRGPLHDKASKGLPGWNSDFSVQYQETLSIRDQERALGRKAQGRTKPPLAAAGSMDRHSGTAKTQTPTESQGSLPVLKNSTHRPGDLQNSNWLLPSAVSHQTQPAAHTQRFAGAGKGSAVRKPNGHEQYTGGALSNKPRRDSTAYSRNLDSAQSPLRPAKGDMAPDETALCKLNKFCFLPIQVGCKHSNKLS